MAPEDVLGISEVATLFNVARNTAWRWSRRPDFPEPLARLASGPVWEKSAIEAWGKANLPLPPGRPRKAP